MKRFPPAVRIRKKQPHQLLSLGGAASFFKPDDSDVVFYSAQGEGYSVSDHLVWLHGMLQHHSKPLKRMRDNGADIIVEIHSDSRDLVIDSNALLLPHKLGIPMEIKFQK